MELELESLLQESSDDDGAGEFEDGYEPEEQDEGTVDGVGYEWDASSESEWGQLAEREQLAYELMSLSGEAEVDEFLGKLVGFARKKLSSVAKRVAPKLLPMLKGPMSGLLKKALPLVGGALGSAVPGVGTMLGGMAGQGLGKLLGGEMEFATEEEAKLDLSRRLVDVVSNAVSDAAQDPRALTDPLQAARGALVNSMRNNLPSGVRSALATSGATAASGRWVRRGNTIVLLGV